MKPLDIEKMAEQKAHNRGESVHLTREQRTEAIKAACNGDVDPKKLAEKIHASTTDEYTPIEQWLASNYLMALHMIELYQIQGKLLSEAKPAVRLEKLEQENEKLLAIIGRSEYEKGSAILDTAEDQRWRSVAERLPLQAVSVLGMCSERPTDDPVICFRTVDEDWIWVASDDPTFCKLEGITHWMPLPAKPE